MMMTVEIVNDATGTGATEWPDVPDDAYEVRRLRAIIESAIRAGDLPPGVVYLDPIHKPSAGALAYIRERIAEMEAER